MIVIEDITDRFIVPWKTLQRQLRVIEQKFPKAAGTEAYGDKGWGGWSLTSLTGEVSDGWFKGQENFERTEDGGVIVKDKLRLMSVMDYTKFTPIATPQFKNVFRYVATLGFFPRRARLVQLPPGGKSNWHVDSTPEQSLARIHFIIETNPEAKFITEDGTYHLAEHRVYIFNTCGFHQVVNNGETNRTHLMMDVTDTKGVSKHHRHTSK